MMHGVKKAALTLLLCASMVTQTAIPTYALTDSSVSDTDDVDSEYTDTADEGSTEFASTDEAEETEETEEPVGETEDATETAGEESSKMSNEITSFADSENLQGITYTVGKDDTDKDSILLRKEKFNDHNRRLERI